jgi:multiple sugar transport system ATP-binding protein
VQAAFRERHDFHPGQKIRLRPRLEYVHVFDAESGARIAG